MKKVLLSVAVVANLAFATDYSTMPLDEMMSKKGTIAPEEREAFRTEMQKKMQSLSPEERSQMRSSNNSKGNGQQLRDGSGGGSMNRGSGNGMGKNR